MKSSRALLIGLGLVVVAAALGWFSYSRSSTTDNASSPGEMPGMTSGETTTDMAMGNSDSMPAMTPLVKGADGTASSAGGLTIEPQHAVLPANIPTRWQLRVTDRAGMPVVAFERDQTKLLHLIVVRGDLTGYQHLHPTLGPNGVFTVELRLPKPGRYRAIADFTTAGRRYALGVSITVPGTSNSTPLPAAAMDAAVDGYRVTLAHGALTAGVEQSLHFTVEQHGAPVTALLPYLGAYGHLVGLRRPDLAYSHIHPSSRDRAMGMIAFGAEFPRSGTYRLFLQFRTASGVHTAPFTLDISA